MINRRHLLLGGLSSLTAASLGLPAYAARKAKIVIVGGGFGGATATHFLSRLLPESDITLVGATKYFPCPFSNLLIDDETNVRDHIIEFDLGKLPNVTHLNTTAVSVSGTSDLILPQDLSIPFDRLILSPGIDFRPFAGDAEFIRTRMPAAWGSFAELEQLRKNLKNMADGGTVVISVPEAPYRCPPGPYERASLIAHYLKTQKPRSKLIVLDAKDKFSKMELFKEAWAEHYRDHLGWRGASDDGRVLRIDASDMTVHTDFEDIQVDVANIIPPQKAASFAEKAQVTDASGWCPINGLSFESKLQKNIYVIGDASIANPMPKSAYSANMQAKICAIAVARSLMDRPPEPTVLANTCYSFIAPDEAISISAVYRNNSGVLKSVEGAGGMSPLAADRSVRKQEAAQAHDWYHAITAEAFG